ncbi:MAG: ImmA/IrrE family metallo-endopeptidase [Bacteroidota bacterium]
MDYDFSGKVKAIETRRYFGLNELEPVDVFKILRDCLDVHIVYKPLESKVSGFFLRNGKLQIVLINTAKSWGHQRFTAAHELFHLRYDEGLSHRVCTTGRFDKNIQEIEREADYFASNFLLPADGVADRIYKYHKGKKERLTMGDLIDLEQYFNVSHQALLTRLQILKYITPLDSNKLRDGVISTARLLGYSVDLYKPTNEDKLLSSYAKDAKAALEKGLITEGKYEQLLLEAGYADLLYGVEEVDFDEDI